jgi:hypothetical protein
MRLCTMSTLAEIETAADSLSRKEQEELLRFLAMRLQNDGAIPPARHYPDEEQATEFAEHERAGEMPLTGRRSGKAGAWLRTAKGSVRAAVGESANDMRLAYYAAKYGLTR